MNNNDFNEINEMRIILYIYNKYIYIQKTVCVT